jgi:Protein of unknown function (DUF3788)
MVQIQEAFEEIAFEPFDPFMKSIFNDKSTVPTNPDLEGGLMETFHIWHEIAAFTIQNYPQAVAGWHFSGEKFGWSFRINDHKRVLVYLLPRDGFFKVALVFGQKALDQIFESDISQSIKTELENTKKYAEGKGIRIAVNDPSNLADLQKLIQIKIAN